MPIDTDRNVVFVHIPKTGGSSIAAMLGLTKPIHFVACAPIPGLSPTDRTPQHFTWRELRPHLSQEFATAAFKAAFVRNPWDRFLSEYTYRRRWSLSGPQDEVGRVYGPEHLRDLDSFVANLDLPAVLRRDAFRGFDAHLETQRSFLVDERDQIAFDFIGRFENFEDDARTLGRHLGVEVQSVPHIKRGRADREYRSAFSSYAKAAVEDFYREDIEEFGYRF